jgi:serpin B
VTTGSFDRRRFLAVLAAVPGLAALLQACGDDIDAPATVTRARSPLTRAAADPSSAVAAGETVQRFGTDLYRQLAAADPTGNLVVSPASIALALAMVTAGAAGTTLTELLDVLHVGDDTDADDLHDWMNSLDDALASRALGIDGRKVAGQNVELAVELSIANAIWLQAGMSVQQVFLDLLASRYGAGAELVDFGADPDRARTAINAWVAEQTKGRIDDLIPDGALDELTRVVLVNAAYLRAQWARPFLTDATVDATFTNAAGDVVEVAMMRQEAEFPYATGDGWQAVELPYAGGELAMLLFLPEPGFLETFEQIFLITDATRYLETRRVNLRLPRWDTSSQLELRAPLTALGLTTAFDDSADFTGITVDEDLRIASVVHQATITVDEQGTEAAAATAAIAEATSAPPPAATVELVFDRPFVFALRDRPTGAVLFLGRVGDPTG